MCPLFRLFAPALVLSAAAASSYAGDDPGVPRLSGYVTAVKSASTIEVEGVSVELGNGVAYAEHDAQGTRTLQQRPGLWVGERVAVFGTEAAGGALRVTRLELDAEKPAAAGSVAITDRLPGAGAPVGVQVPAGARMVRADGYWLVLTPESEVTYVAPLTKDAPLTTNLWVDYRGVQQADGSVLVKRAAFSQNRIKGGEKRMRERVEFAPEAVPTDAHQSWWSEAFLGVNPKKLPPWQDEAMQARVRRIGARVVPAYQKALPTDDPTRIEFRFGVVDSKYLKRSMALPNGIVLMAYQEVGLLQNDDQLAAVLALDVAVALEKQTYRDNGKETAAAIAVDAAGLFPPFGLLALPGGFAAEHHMALMREQQSGRVSLQLMADAGFDVREAPRAWWVLSLKKGKTMETQGPSKQAAYLYDQLGTTWRAALQKGVADGTGAATGGGETAKKD